MVIILRSGVVLAVVDADRDTLVAGDGDNDTGADLTRVPASGLCHNYTPCDLSVSGVLRCDLAGTLLGEETSDVLLDVLDASRVVELARGHLEAKVEELGAALLDLLGELLVGELLDVLVLH